MKNAAFYQLVYINKLKILLTCFAWLVGFCRRWNLRQINKLNSTSAEEKEKEREREGEREKGGGARDQKFHLLAASESSYFVSPSSVER